MSHLVCISHFAKYGTNRLNIDCMRNANNVQNTLFRSGEENEKVIQNPHANPDHF